jgi:phage shock protein C
VPATSIGPLPEAPGAGPGARWGTSLMTGALARAHDGAMETTVTDDRPPPRPRVLRRPAEGRIIGGVAAAVADYLDLDPSVVRIGAVALVLLGGAGVPLYLAGWLLIPADGAPSSVAEDLLGHARAR